MKAGIARGVTKAGPVSRPVMTPVVVTTGCPSGVGPEITLAALRPAASGPAVIVGDRGSLVRVAAVCGWSAEKVAALPNFDPGDATRGRVSVLQPTKSLRSSECRPGRPSGAAGVAQLDFIEAGYALASARGWPLVTGPVSKEVIAKSGLLRARSFLGHTEWLEAMDGAPYSVMCFSSPQLTTSLVTTHVPLARVGGLLRPELVSRAIVELAELLFRASVKSHRRPTIAVCSFNPHAGEGALLGQEEATAILPGVLRSREVLGRRAKILGPIGAETAYRKGVAGDFDGVVGIYHDQATIPMKLLDFGGAVNVTQGLSIVRTSVDHGTAYDIAGKGLASSRGMSAAIRLARQLSGGKRRLPLGTH